MNNSTMKMPHTAQFETSDGTYEIRPMSRDDLAFAVDLAANEGWNPGLHDAECFYATDPNGFFIGLLDGEPISCISVVKYPNNYAFLGFYIVKESYRGKGYGYKIWQHAMQYVEGYTIGLDGVLAQIKNYEKSGFVLSHQNARYQGIASSTNSIDDSRLVDLSDIPFDTLASYDEAIFGFERTAFLKLWISRPQTIAIGLTNSDDANGLSGYAVARPCREGYKIGALFADNARDAEALFTEISSRIPDGTTIFLDIPDETKNAEAKTLVDNHQMQAVFATARMYRAGKGQVDNIPYDKWFGVTTFELG